MEAELETLMANLDAEGSPEAKELAQLMHCRLSLHRMYMSLDECIVGLQHATNRARRDEGLPDQDAMKNFKAKVTASAQAAQPVLQSFAASVSSGEAAAVKTHMDASSAAQEVQFAFSTTLVKMMQNSPIRHVEFKPLPDAAKYLSALCSEITSTCSMVAQWTSAAAAGSLTLDSLLQALIAFSARRPHVISRSLLVSALGLLCLDMDAFVKRSMRSHGLPSSLVDWELLTSFIEEVLSKVCWDTARALTVNRNKVLIKLDSLLSSWGTVMTEMGDVGSQFLVYFGIADDRQMWCQFWTLLHTTLLMDLFMGVSAESNLLSNNELDYFYWYWDFICNTRCWAFERLRGLAHDLRLQLYEQELEGLNKAGAGSSSNSSSSGGSSSSSGGGKKGGAAKAKDIAPSSSSSKAPPRPTPAPPPAEPAMSLDETLQRSKGHLCKGIFRMLVVAHQWGLLSRRENKYTSWHWRFMQRFRSFNTILNPPMLSYDEFLRVLSMGRDKVGGAADGGGDDGEGRPESSEGGGRGIEDAEDHQLAVDPAISRRVLQDAGVCFNSARLLLAEAKKAVPLGLGEIMALEISAPLLKVGFVVYVIVTELTELVAACLLCSHSSCIALTH